MVIQKRKVKVLACESRHSQVGPTFTVPLTVISFETIPEMYSQANTKKLKRNIT
ncbi:MAG: hypothetical protein M3093_04245 [Thermoproteota archaeon]|nr:hypothetical protein [Thermoproteota archaeon]